MDNTIVEIHDEPMFGSDRGWSFLKFTDTMLGRGPEDSIGWLGSAGSVGRVAVLPAEDCMSDRDMCNNDVNSAGFQRWNTDLDVVNYCRCIMAVIYLILRIQNGTVL